MSCMKMKKEIIIVKKCKQSTKVALNVG
uniref:Uncharacterized protein n=1 Tax=Anguilla anguilla TaxID=7936 RepID=A0A0E9UV34_ANGAN